MKLSRYVFATEGVLYNTVTRKSLPIDSNKEDLGRHFFLDGQEQDALEAALFPSPECLQVNVVTTWECNLRCKHCSVLHLLKTKQKGDIDCGRLMGFVDRHHQRYGTTRMHPLYIGGESLLRPDKCMEIHSSLKGYCDSHAMLYSPTITSNLSMDMTTDHLDFLRQMPIICVSVDGNERQHNWQRKATDGSNPFNKTMDNIAVLAEEGMRERIIVQAAVQDEMVNMEDKIDFIRTMLKAGILFKNISYGSVHPTKQDPKADTNYLNSMKNVMFPRKCCAFRYMSFFVIDSDNKLKSDYYDRDGYSIVGEFEDELDAVERRYKDKIRSHMPMLKDPVCTKSCAAVGNCWGGCINGKMLVGDKPSDYCGRDTMEQRTAEMAAAGTLRKTC